MATTYDIDVKQGETLDEIFDLVDENDAVIPIASGASARMMVRAEVDDPDPPLFSFTSGAGDLIITEPSGRVQLKISATVTAGATVSGHYDLELVDHPAAGEVFEVVRGRWNLIPEVTR